MPVTNKFQSNPKTRRVSTDFPPSLLKAIKCLSSENNRSMTDTITELCYSAINQIVERERSTTEDLRIAINNECVELKIPLHIAVQVCFDPNLFQEQILPYLKKSYGNFLAKDPCEFFEDHCINSDSAVKSQK